MAKMEGSRWWESPWSLVDGCTPCSLGCDHCWSAGIAHRFGSWTNGWNPDRLTDIDGTFTGRIITHPERLSIPLKRRKPTVYAVWNDWAHESVPREFIVKMLDTAMQAYFERGHVTLFLTKRAGRAAQEVLLWAHLRGYNLNDCGLFFGLTVCNQQEADEKIPVFLQVPGWKFLSLEPMLEVISLRRHMGWLTKINTVILGGETGPGARPMHPDWVRSIRDQCAAAGVPFFFKQWGEFTYRPTLGDSTGRPKHFFDDGLWMEHVGRKEAGRLLDGRTHDELPWRVT